MRFFDGLRNLVSGLGTTRDKSAGAAYFYVPTDPAAMFAAYHASSLVRRAIDIPAEDACREWREWQAKSVDIGAIEAEEDRLDLQRKVKSAQILARLFGGAAIVIGTGEAGLSKPLAPETIGRGGLKHLTVMSMADVTPGMLDRVPASETYGKPMWWQIGAEMLRVHPTRLAIFHGVPPVEGAANMTPSTGWGDSVLPGMLDAIRRVDEVAGNVNSLIYEAKIDILKVPNFMTNLASRGEAYSQEVIRRATLAATAKGINGMLLLDANEEYEQKSASFGGLPEILDRMMQIASAKSGIPATLLFGMAPAGLNATGESDIRIYYDRVRVMQTLQIEPAMAILDECLIRSALGDRPKELHFTWRPLWQQSAEQRAKVGDLLMTALTKLHGIGQVPVEAIAEAGVNGLTECGAFPGLEAATLKFASEGPPDPDEDGVTPPDDDPEKEAENGSDH